MSHGDPLKPVSSFMSTFSPHFHPYPVKQARTGRAKTCCLRRASALAHGHTLSDSVTCLTTDPWQGCSGNVGSFIVPVIKVSAVSWEGTSAMKSCLDWLLHSHWLALAQGTENLSGMRSRIQTPQCILLQPFFDFCALVAPVPRHPC